MKSFFAICLILSTSVACIAQPDKIRVNQVGYYPSADKTAIVLSVEGGSFTLVDATGRVQFTGTLKEGANKTMAGQTVWTADFSKCKTPGRYAVKLSNGDRSYFFNISDKVYDNLAKASIKAFYYQRASIPLREKYAGKWQREEGHADDHVLIHPSAATVKRPVGTVISSARGWYDAGDYNKYIVNSGITMGTLLSLYEDFSSYMKTVALNIPETGNKVPDLLNEALWNLRWMLTMQDPNDGGVYHKLTNAAFDGMIMPDKAVKPRYVVAKSTAATLDFAAVMAQSARILKKFNTTFPGLADSCLRASLSAWKWAKANPRAYYQQNKLNQTFEPAVTTGEYGDNDVSDEFIWAAAELYVTTKDGHYLSELRVERNPDIQVPSWAQVKTMGYYSLIRNKASLTPNGQAIAGRLQTALIHLADSLVADGQRSAYFTPISNSPKNLIWGSNSVAANQGVALLEAYLNNRKPSYLATAMATLNYLSGCNGTGYCYVTGYGTKSPLHPHHRPSVADGIVQPIPGLLVGGPNPGMQDHIQLPSIVPGEAYIDDDRAYAVNEIAINWNAPLVYLVNGINALKAK
ncbi:glycoside hydrolase family 9 protein [Mucilaginibacter ginkgonis]|uniref:Endoglucanase n=1 Tax=Mucilaginibacter ginkgonis TaxID=2682091 RepID=A0A6I4HU75_9SPHI|nr:glycoside hydrolase family 9 protein [Mucilaginibacter ginkgonis]QQL50292.1 glycoside hydrolase family 9 protein [Mucilaginibacter ginkgonis]